MIFAINNPVKVPVLARKNAAPAVQINCLERNIDNFSANKRACIGGFAAKQGFTLIELLVYMAIMGFIIVVAGRAFSDSTSMRVRSQNMLTSAEEAGRVSALLKEDISQMGTKSWIVPIAGVPVFKSAESVQMSGGDRSSFDLIRENAHDRLIFRKAHYDVNGVCGAVLEIEWYVDENGNLIRKCEEKDEPECTGIYDEPKDCPESVEMASNVTEFTFTPSKPGHSENSDILSHPYFFPGKDSIQLFPTPTQPNITPNKTNFRFIKRINGTPTVSNGTSLPPLNFTTPPDDKFRKNTEGTAAIPDNYLLGTGNVITNCTPIDFEAGEEYAIEFDLLSDIPRPSDVCITGATTCSSEEQINKMAMFQTGRDHLSVGLRKSSDGSTFSDIPDFLFYPPQQNTADGIRRHFTLSVPGTIPQTISACVGVTVAIYSDEVIDGHLDFEDFKVYRKIDRVYHFEDGYIPDNNFKYTVKAFKLEFGVGKGGKEKEITHTAIVIPVPSNGIAGGGP